MSRPLGTIRAVILRSFVPKKLCFHQIAVVLGEGTGADASAEGIHSDVVVARVHAVVGGD